MSGMKGFIGILKYSLQQDHFGSSRRMTDAYLTDPFILFSFFTISHKKEKHPRHALFLSERIDAYSKIVTRPSSQ